MWYVAFAGLSSGDEREEKRGRALASLLTMEEVVLTGRIDGCCQCQEGVETAAGEYAARTLCV